MRAYFAIGLALVGIVGYFLVIADKDLTGEIFALLGGAIGAAIGCIWPSPGQQ